MLVISIAFAGMLMSFKPAVHDKKNFFKHIDLTFTSPGGCIFHIVGEADINLLKRRVTGFTGTITLSGPPGCPQGTFNVSMVTLQAGYGGLVGSAAGESLSLQFNTDNVCSISAVTFSTDSPGEAIQEVRNTLNNSTGFKTTLIDEIKEGVDCR